ENDFAGKSARRCRHGAQYEARLRHRQAARPLAGRRGVLRRREAVEVIAAAHITNGVGRKPRKFQAGRRRSWPIVCLSSTPSIAAAARKTTPPNATKAPTDAARSIAEPEYHSVP